MSRFVTVRAAPDTAPLVDFLQRPASDWGSVEILKHERGTTVCVVSSPVGAIVVKRHALKSWRRQADAVVHGSPALRAWTGAALLERHGIAVPRPLAALERRDGAIISECLYASEALLTQVPLPVYWRQRCVGYVTADDCRQRRWLYGNAADIHYSHHQQQRRDINQRRPHRAGPTDSTGNIAD